MKLIKFLLATVTILIALLLLIPTIVFVILHYWILTPEYLTSTVQNTVNEYTYIDFDCKKIELDYLNSWPYISLAIHEGRILIPEQKDSTYTKGSIAFHKIYSNIKLSKLLTEKSLQIEDVFIENLHDDDLIVANIQYLQLHLYLYEDNVLEELLLYFQIHHFLVFLQVLNQKHSVGILC